MLPVTIKEESGEAMNDETTASGGVAPGIGDVAHKVLVLSGKGGVGKSTIAVNLAVSLAMQGLKVGLLDVDIHGPSVPMMLGLGLEGVRTRDDTLVPVESAGIKVMSVGFLLRNTDDALIWRGPMKMNLITQFIRQVEWGRLDVLVVDCPPGTGDEPLSVVQLLPGADGALIVTTPQKVAAADVRKSVDFCRKTGLPVLGVVENMSGFVCPKCGEASQIFRGSGGEDTARAYSVPFLGRIPLDPAIVESGDQGRPFVYHYGKSPSARAMEAVAEPVLRLLN